MAKLGGNRRTPAQIEQLENQIIEELAGDNPQSVRHLFYRMTDPRLPEPVEKTEIGYRQLQDRTVKMRTAGTIPYEWIEDNGRRADTPAAWDNVRDFLDAVRNAYQANPWAEIDERVEVWTESDSLAGTLRTVCRDCRVTLCAAHGFSSITFVHDAAMRIAANDLPTSIYYVGDFDPAGVLIDVDIETKLREFLPYDYPLEFDRIGITESQIVEYDLPTKPRKETDRRRPDIAETVEAEAMPAPILRGLVADAIHLHLPDDWRADADADTTNGRQEIGRLIDLSG